MNDVAVLIRSSLARPFHQQWPNNTYNHDHAVSAGELSQDVRDSIAAFDQAGVLLSRLTWTDTMLLRSVHKCKHLYSGIDEALEPLLVTDGIVVGSKISDKRFSEVCPKKTKLCITWQCCCTDGGQFLSVCRAHRPWTDAMPWCF